MRKLRLAERLSAHIHDGQKYGQYDYYDTHILDVVGRVGFATSHLPKNEQEDYLIVAYLHDVLEDAAILEETLENLFGPKITDAVRVLSKSYCYLDCDFGISRTNEKSYEDYITDIKYNEIALLVKICDTQANLTASVIDHNQKRIDKYTKQLGLLKSDI